MFHDVAIASLGRKCMRITCYRELNDCDTDCGAHILLKHGQSVGDKLATMILAYQSVGPKKKSLMFGELTPISTFTVSDIYNI
jgi:hypothetical protein